MPRIDARFSNWRVDLGHLAVAYRQRRPKHRSQPQPGFSYTLSVNAFVKVIGRWKAFMTDQSLVWCCVTSLCERVEHVFSRTSPALSNHIPPDHLGQEAIPGANNGSGDQTAP
ncbi:hypothetical protein FVEG_08133 [Fusarium verticillioides 7600]|uniref:Uncharacterized protein n=1 Tax=Gibberella moniliformis (strain M3125 / FGSC 7600) TaxID=334819 RepID=W7MKL0_GIBM7|nr:hypothetical protein FVEG_08133 [Fusarium verticillioides 7600]EWG48319.1 hypothetical protein FVEG_08133 [Fusarium verticillioides 7600]